MSKSRARIEQAKKEQQKDAGKVYCNKLLNALQRMWSCIINIRRYNTKVEVLSFKITSKNV